MNYEATGYMKKKQASKQSSVLNCFISYLGTEDDKKPTKPPDNPNTFSVVFILFLSGSFVHMKRLKVI